MYFLEIRWWYTKLSHSCAELQLLKNGSLVTLLTLTLNNSSSALLILTLNNLGSLSLLSKKCIIGNFSNRNPQQFEIYARAREWFDGVKLAMKALPFVCMHGFYGTYNYFGLVRQVAGFIRVKCVRYMSFSTAGFKGRGKPCAMTCETAVLRRGIQQALRT